MSAHAPGSPRIAAFDLLRMTLGLALSAVLVACGDRDGPTGARPAGQPLTSLAFADFNTPSMNFGGSAGTRNGALTLTSGPSQLGAAWYPVKQRLSATWETTFQFQVASAGCGQFADGFAFVIQNHGANALATGTGGSDLGYSGFKNALAVEFDVFRSDFYPDPDGNHVAVVGMNAPPATTISARNTPMASVSIPSIKDGGVHTVRMVYGLGKLNIYYDGSAAPVLAVSLNLLNVNGTNILDANGAAWVGFTAATGGQCAQFKILSWSLVDNKAPSASAGGTVGPDGIASYDAVEATPLTLTASATDPDGDAISNFEWDFNNDGVVDLKANTPSVSHTFASCGVVPISVVAIDALGSRSAPGPARVNVANENPTLAALQQLEAYPGQPMSMSTSFSDPGADGPWTYRIDWGDGTAGIEQTTTDPRAVITGSHTYGMSKTESYPLTVSVKDKCGGMSTAQTTVKMLAIAATVRLDNLSQLYDGQAKAVAAVTDPEGLPLEITYDASPTVPTNAGSYFVVAKVSDPRYVGSATGTLTIQRASVQVQLGDLTGITYDGTAKAATVTTVPQGVRVLVKYDGSVTAPVEAGSYAVSASTDDPNYDGSASGTLVIAKARAALKLEQLEHKYDGSQKSARVTSDPQGVVIISTRYNELPDAPVRAGSYAVRAWLTNRNYGATPVTGTLLIQKATQAIDFAPLAHHTVGDAPVALSARGGSSTSPVQYALGPASVGCSLSGSTLSIDAATADGQACTVVARQAGDDNYEPAADVAQSFTIGKAAPRIAWATPADLVFGAPLGAAQLNAAAIGVNGSTVGGSFSYSPAAGTELSVGNYTLTATFTPTDLSYGPGSASVPLRVRYLTTRGHQFIDPFGGRAAVKIGPKLYFAFQLFKADGQTPVSTARATMVIQPLSPTGTLGEPVTLTEGNAFAFESHLQLYWFDLKTKDLAPGTYRARAMLDDGSEIVGEVSVTVSRGRPDDETTATPPSVDRGRPKGDKDDKDDELAADPRRPVETKPPVLRKP